MIFGIDRIPADLPAFRSDTGDLWVYKRLTEAVSRFADLLPGRCLVFCLCRNVPEAAAGYLGILEQGSCALLLGDNIDSERLKLLEEIYKPACFWMPLREGEEPVYKEGSYGLYMTGYTPYHMNEDLSLLLSTSGSTGSPKLIRLSRRNLEANAYSIMEYLELNETERPLTVLPMQYTFGLSVINSHLCAGACILMTEKSVVQQEFWDFLKKYGGTSLSGVPYTYELLKRIRFPERDDISSITSMIQAGGHLPLELQEFYGKWAEEHKVRFYVMYGQTEATARMSYLPYRDMLRKTGTIGIAIPGGRFEIQDMDHNIITEPDTVGELVYYGENVSLGYASCAEDLAKPDENKGVLHTGDMALRDSEGYYKIKGRLNRFLKLYGVRVGLDECEEILKGLDRDAIFACGGSDERLIIFTDSNEYEQAPEYLAERIGIDSRAIEARYVRDIPVKDTGKIDHKALAAYI